MQQLNILDREQIRLIFSNIFEIKTVNAQILDEFNKCLSKENKKSPASALAGLV